MQINTGAGIKRANVPRGDILCSADGGLHDRARLASLSLACTTLTALQNGAYSATINIFDVTLWILIDRRNY
jgi:hypothetical protein